MLDQATSTTLSIKSTREVVGQHSGDRKETHSIYHNSANIILWCVEFNKVNDRLDRTKSHSKEKLFSHRHSASWAEGVIQFLEKKNPQWKTKPNPDSLTKHPTKQTKYSIKILSVSFHINISGKEHSPVVKLLWKGDDFVFLEWYWWV